MGSYFDAIAARANARIDRTFGTTWTCTPAADGASPYTVTAIYYGAYDRQTVAPATNMQMELPQGESIDVLVSACGAAPAKGDRWSGIPDASPTPGRATAYIADDVRPMRDGRARIFLSEVVA